MLWSTVSVKLAEKLPGMGTLSAEASAAWPSKPCRVTATSRVSAACWLSGTVCDLVLLQLPYCLSKVFTPWMEAGSPLIEARELCP